MSRKYARFFSIGGRMQWDSIKDDADLEKRIVGSMDDEERAQFEAERAALNKLGGWIQLPYAVIVRVGE